MRFQSMNWDYLINLLHEAHLKATSGRLAVLEVLIASEIPLSHKEVHELVREKTGLDRVSIYRILDVLTGKGIVHRIDTNEHTWRFEWCNCGRKVHHHPHFTCRICGKVECMKNIPMPEYGKVKGYRIEDQEINIHGVCAACNED
jgi:Fur family transcriptional regulator, ferric uptake regulator